MPIIIYRLEGGRVGDEGMGRVAWFSGGTERESFVTNRVKSGDNFFDTRGKYCNGHHIVFLSVLIITFTVFVPVAEFCCFLSE